MGGSDLLFIILCKSIIFFIYGGVVIISVIFTLSVDTYIRINDLLNIMFSSQKTISPIEEDIDIIDDWLITHNKIIGPILALLSLLDIVILFRITDLL